MKKKAIVFSVLLLALTHQAYGTDGCPRNNTVRPGATAPTTSPCDEHGVELDISGWSLDSINRLIGGTATYATEDQKVRTLVCCDNQNINDGNLTAIVTRLPDLEELNVRHCLGLTSAGFITAIKNGGFKALKRLDASCADLTDEALEALADIPGLEELNVGYSGQLTGSGFITAIKNRGFKALKRLDASCTDLTDEALKALAGISGLEELNVSYCWRLTCAGFITAKRSGGFRGLKKLDIGGLDLIDEGLKAIAGILGNLENLRLFYH